MEKWRPVVVARGKVLKQYQVSDRGRVRTLVAPGHRDVPMKPRPKSVFPDRGGFMNVSLAVRPGRASVLLVHQLVATAFLGPKPSKRHVAIHLNHKFGDNRAKNLRWVTKSDAVQHSMRHRPRRGPAKLTLKDVRWIRASSRTVKQIAAKYDVTVQTIYGIQKRHTWKDEREV